jgi:hypothetical protein
MGRPPGTLIANTDAPSKGRVTEAEPSVIADLLARAEAATGPNFELEHTIFEALSLPTIREWNGAPVTSWFRDDGYYGFNTEDGYRHLRCIKAPAVTASLDAALALVERVLPEAYRDLGEGYDTKAQRRYWIATFTYHVPGRGSHSAEAATPALALIAALLRALQNAAPVGDRAERVGDGGLRDQNQNLPDRGMKT